jgi:hypothetical protein
MLFPMREQPQTIEVPPLCVRAAVSTVNEDKRTVDLVFSTGAAVERYDWMSGGRYREVLSLNPDHVRIDRLNTIGPLLDAHSSYSIADQIGAVEPGTVRITKNGALATVRFSKRDAVEPIWRDVVDGIIKSVSVGYRVLKFEEDKGVDGAIPTRTATLWEPYEISMVPMPADAGARVRSSQIETNPCVLVTRTQESTTMSENQPESIAERNPLDPGAPITPRLSLETPAATEPTEADQGADVERARIRGIMDGCTAARIPTAFMNRLIDNKVPLVKAQAEILDELRKRGYDEVAPQRPHSRGPEVAGGVDNLVHVRSGIVDALLHRINPSAFKLTDTGRLYRGMNMLDVARSYLQARGQRVTDMTKNQLAGEALGLTNRGGMHTTSDFSDLLADVANKSLRRAYEEQPQTWAPLASRNTLPDYKTVKRLQFGDAPSLLEIKEHGEYTFGTIGEGKEEYGLVKYGRKFAITREAIINDDLNAFSRLPMMFGRKSRILESDLVWRQITSNPTMGDGNALFSAAHANLETDGDHISVVSLGRARASLRVQTSLDGSYLNLSARYLLVPTVIETKADQFVTVITPQLSGNVNPFQGKLQVIAEPRLDANSATAWYTAASPDQVDMIEVAYLEGEEGPQVESRVGFDVDGVEIKCRLDFGAKVIDWRGFHKDPGDLDS